MPSLLESIRCSVPQPFCHKGDRHTDVQQPRFRTVTEKVNLPAPRICKSFHAVTLKQSERLKGYLKCNYIFADFLLIIARSLC